MKSIKTEFYTYFYCLFSNTLLSYTLNTHANISYKNILIILSFSDINQDTNGRIANSPNMISPKIKRSRKYFYILCQIINFPLHYLILPLFIKIYDNITFLLLYKPTENFGNKKPQETVFMKHIKLANICCGV